MIGPRVSGARRALWRAGIEHALLAMLPVGLTIYLLWFVSAHHLLAVDFTHAFWGAGGRVLHGLSPYPAVDAQGVQNGTAFVYPAPAALLFAPLGLLAATPAAAVVTAAALVSCVAIIALLDVRDWRIYGIVLLWPSTIAAWQTGNLSIFLALGVALAWRHRNAGKVPGITIGLLVALKSFVWPLSLWLIATRRFGALRWSAATFFVLNLAAWCILGTDQLSLFLRVSGAVTRHEIRMAYTPLALALRTGVPGPLAYAAAAALAVAILGLAVRAGRAGRDISALSLSIAGCLAASPAVWSHYLVLLVPALAARRPTFSWPWVVPLALTVCPVRGPAIWQLCLTLLVGVVLVTAISSGQAQPDRRAADRGRRRFRLVRLRTT